MVEGGQEDNVGKGLCEARPRITLKVIAKRRCTKTSYGAATQEFKPRDVPDFEERHVRRPHFKMNLL